MIFNLTDTELIGLGKTLGHPTRLGIVRDLSSGLETCSAKSWSQANDESLGNAYFHFQTLVKLGVVSVARTEGRRGAMEHFYQLDGRLRVPLLTTLDLLEGRVETIAPYDFLDPGTETGSPLRARRREDGVD